MLDRPSDEIERERSFLEDIDQMKRVRNDQRTSFVYVATHEVRTTKDKKTILIPNRKISDKSMTLLHVQN